MRKVILYSIDVAIIALAPYVALFLRYDFEPTWDKVVDLVPYATACIPVTVACLLIGQIYRVPWRHITLAVCFRIAFILGVSIVITAFISFFWKWIEHVPRSVPPLQWFVLTMAICGSRFVSRRWNAFTENYSNSTPGDHKPAYALVVGRTTVCELFLRCLKDLTQGAVEVVGLLDENPDSKGKVFHSHRVVGSPQNLAAIISEFSVHAIDIGHVIVTVPFANLSQESRDSLLKMERMGTIKLDLLQERLKIQTDNQEHTSGSEIKPNVEASETDIEINVTYARVKRAIEIPAAAIMIVLFSPLMLATALLIAMNLGFPVLFWQQRLGLGGRPFNIFKFRTMRPGHNELGEVLSDQERVSKVGRFLRRSKLDELPQLFHVLVGDMSFVGPRCMRVVRQPENGDIRLSIRPGITGWGQVNGGHSLDDNDKLALDVWYLRNCSLRLDLQIILMTLRVCIFGEKINYEAIRIAKGDHEQAVVSLAA